LRPPNLADAHRNLLCRAEVQPTDLVVLQPIAGAFYLNEAVTVLRGPQLNQIRQAAAIGTYVGEQSLQELAPMLGGHAIERQLQLSATQPVPGDEGRLDAAFALKCVQDGVTIAAVGQLLESCGELSSALQT